MKIAIHQFCSEIQPNANLATIEKAVTEASTKHAEFYFAPEMSVLLDRDVKRSAAHINTVFEEHITNRLSDIARSNTIWLHIGSVPLVDPQNPDKRLNRTMLFNPQGRLVAHYDKMHLFDVDLNSGESWRESKIYQAGDKPVIAQTDLGAMGLSICYDLRFPELYSALARAGAQILAVPAAFTVPTGKAHWHTLLRARAIESASFVIAAAQCGQHEDGRSTYGHSLVVDPWGTILLDMKDEIGLGFAEIDLVRVAEARRQIPVHENRRDIGEVNTVK